MQDTDDTNNAVPTDEPLQKFWRDVHHHLRRHQDDELTTKGLRAAIERSCQTYGYGYAATLAVLAKDPGVGDLVRDLLQPPPEVVEAPIAPSQVFSPAAPVGAGPELDRTTQPTAEAATLAASETNRAEGETASSAAATSTGSSESAVGVPVSSIHDVLPAADARTTARGPSRKLLFGLVGSGLIVALVVGGVFAMKALSGPNVDDQYLKHLRSQGLGGEFASDAAALAHGRQVCRHLTNGGKQVGSVVDQVAVKGLCPEFAQGFHVLEHATIEGSFELIDSDIYSSSIDDFGSGCSGSGGYSDIDSGTSVLVKNDAGRTIASTSLGDGSGSGYSCTFDFSFDVTEGESDYVVSVSHRGEQHYTFARLQADGVALTLGD